jgi:hypothetical protein
VNVDGVADFEAAGPAFEGGFGWDGVELTRAAAAAAAVAAAVAVLAVEAGPSWPWEMPD